MDLWNQQMDLLQDAKRIASWYNRFKQHDWHELYSAALFGWIQGIRWIEDGRCDHDNHKAYVLATMHRFVKEQIRDDHLVRIPHQKATEYMKTNEQHKIPLIVTDTQGLGAKILYFNRDEEYSDRIKNPLHLKGKLHHQPLDFEDLCSMFTPQERQIIDWAMSRYTYREMAKMMDVSPMTIKRIMDGIKTKLRVEFDFLRKDSDVSTNEAGR